MVRNMGIASELGYLRVPDGILVDFKKLHDLPDDEVIDREGPCLAIWTGEPPIGAAMVLPVADSSG